MTSGRNLTVSGASTALQIVQSDSSVRMPTRMQIPTVTEATILATAPGSAGFMAFASDTKRLYLNIDGTAGGWRIVWPVSTAMLTWSGSTHTEGDCTTAGGSVYSTPNGTICRFTSSTVPSGWTQAANWQRYSAASWGGDSCGLNMSTGPTTFSNTAASRKYPGTFALWGTQCLGTYWNYLVSAPDIDYYNVLTENNPAQNRTEVGCY